MSSFQERKERIERLKNYVKQMPISDPSMRFELNIQIENEKLTTSKEIREEIKNLETKIKSKKDYRRTERIKRSPTYHPQNTNIIKKEEKDKQKTKDGNKKEKVEENKTSSQEPKKPKKQQPDDFIIKSDKDYNIDYSHIDFHKKIDSYLKIIPEEDQKLADQRLFKYPQILELNIYHACLSDIYFLYDYIPSGRRKLYKEQNLLLSSEVEKVVEIDQKLMDYKYNNKFVSFFTKELLKAIKSIFNNYFVDKDAVALVAIPPSKKNISPQTKKSIDLIEEWVEKGKNKVDFKIYNFSNFLIRTKTVKSSKEGDRTLKKHQKSIKCQKEEDMPTNMGFIILDDITTSGNTMYSCRDILIDNGYENKDIICLALARTIDINELQRSDEGTILIENPYVEKF